MLRSVLILLSLSLALPVRAQSTPTLPQVGLTQNAKSELLGWMMKSGRLSRKVQHSQLADNLQRGETCYLDGSYRAAANLFGALLLDPSFWELANTPVHDNIRYDLAGALHQQGAYGQARQILMSLVKRKPPSAFRAPAFRKLVDLTLDSGQFEQSLSSLASVKVTSEERDELAYLKGRAMVKLGFPEKAPKAFASVSRHSRFRAAALYLMAVLALEKGDVETATSHLCSIVHQPGGGRFTFLVSKNTLEVIDRAWLSLARIRHDEERYQRAIDSYAMIEPDSPLHSTARYETAWSLFRLGRSAECLITLEDQLNASPAREDWPAARLLLGYALLGNCFFEQANSQFDALSTRLGPGSYASSTRALPAAVRAAVPMKRAERSALRLSRDVSEAIDRLLWAHDMIRKLASGMPMKSIPRPGANIALDLRADSSKARGLSRRLADIRSHVEDKETIKQLDMLQAQIDSAKGGAVEAFAKLNRGRIQQELGDMRLVTAQDLPREYLLAEAKELVLQGAVLDGQFGSVHSLVRAAMKSWRHRASKKVAGWIRLANIGHVDAALGKKQALEIEVQNLAQGRYPFSLFKELAEAGLIDETQEYWPYEGEGWPDEVEVR